MRQYHVVFSITGKCNYKCMHCSVNAPNAPMTDIPFERIVRLLDEMLECGLRKLILIGGEPLIRKDFLQIVDEILVRKMEIIQIFTNGSLVTETLLGELERRKIRPLFMVSFDGVGYHDTMRGVRGAEENFYHTVKLLRKHGFPVACNMCFTKESIYSIPDTIDKLAELGVMEMTVFPPVECGLWEEKYQTQGASIDLIGEVYPKVVEHYISAGWPLDLNLYGIAIFSSRTRKYAVTPKWRAKHGDPSGTPACMTFPLELNISPEGFLSPCYALMSDPYVREQMPDLGKMSLKQALTDSSFTRINELTVADILEHNPKCQSCSHVARCGGGCRLSALKKTGDILGYDPQMCDFFERGYDRLIEEAVEGRPVS